jgi:hypothetical protein
MLVWQPGWRSVILPKFLPRIWGRTMAYVERRERNRGIRYRGLYTAADMAVADGYLDYNPFHEVKIPKVPGRRPIKIATPEQYLRVRG